MEQNLQLTIIVSNGSKENDCDKIVTLIPVSENERTGNVVVLLKACQCGL